MEWLDEYYGQRLNDIRNACTGIYQTNQNLYGDLPFFTPHGPEHYEAVEELIHMLIPEDSINIGGGENEKLSIIERFFLLASAWLHDLGMLPYVFKRVYPDKPIPDEFEIRKLHQITSEEFISQYWTELNVDERFKGALGKLARYHRRIETIDQGDEEFYIDRKRINLKLLAAYLRLADSLDIASSRTPSLPYAVCLAYDMPEDSRFHWVKSRLVSSAYPIPEQNKIIVQFKYPNKTQLTDFMDEELANDCFNSIKRRVIDDLKEELSIISNVLLRAGFAYYLDIEEATRKESFDSRMLNDLKAIFSNLDIMMGPSATKLLEMILMSIANIMGFSPNKNDDPHYFENNPLGNSANLRNEIEKFLLSVEQKVHENRPCHLGLIKLTQQCKQNIEILTDNDPSSLKKCAKKINELYQQHHKARKQIRKNTEALFSKELNGYHKKETINILLYGYSELVTKSICGLRDYLIKKTHKTIPNKSMYGSDVEKALSNRFRIFICEGQPKTQIANNDRLVYHDGSQYAFHIRRHGFSNITIIPDIIAGTVIASGQIDTVFMGANGVTPSYFMHSAGHEALVSLVENRNAKHHYLDALKLILVVAKEKVITFNNDEEPHSTTFNQISKLDFSHFSNLKGCSENRHNTWLCQDKEHIERIYKSRITFMNPREDRVEINRVNYIVSDLGYVRVTPQNAGTVIYDHF